MKKYRYNKRREMRRRTREIARYDPVYELALRLADMGVKGIHLSPARIAHPGVYAKEVLRSLDAMDEGRVTKYVDPVSTE